MTIAAALVGAPPGAVVCVSGDRPTERTTVAVSGVTVRGVGAPLTAGFVVAAADVTIDGFRIDTTTRPPTDGTGVLVTAPGAVVTGNQVLGAANTGIGCDRTARCDGARITGNVVQHADGTGIIVVGTGALVDRNDVSGSTARYADDADGIRFFGTDLVLRRNYVHDIDVPTTPTLDPHEDCFQTFWWMGVTIDRVTIEQNVCTRVGHQCLIATALPSDGTRPYSGGLTFRDNVCNDQGWQAVYLANITGAHIEDNLIGADLRAQGMAFVEGSSGIEVRDNVFLMPTNPLVQPYLVQDASITSVGNVAGGPGRGAPPATWTDGIDRWNVPLGLVALPGVAQPCWAPGPGSFLIDRGTMAAGGTDLLGVVRTGVPDVGPVESPAAPGATCW